MSLSVKPRTLQAILTSILTINTIDITAGEMYELVSHTLISPDGKVNSELQGDFNANGILILNEGEIFVEISIAQPSTGYTDLLQAAGTFEVGDHGVEISVEYQDGRRHKGVLVNPDPNAMTIVVSKEGYVEINVWRQNPFLRNQLILPAPRSWDL